MPPETPEILSVSQITRRVKGLLEGQIGSVWVGGEISNFRVSPAGHSYFTLKDKDSQLDAVMFRGRLTKLGFQPDSGMDVVVYGLISVYEKRGSYQIVCEEMHPKGVGALQLAFENSNRSCKKKGCSTRNTKSPCRCCRNASASSRRRRVRPFATCSTSSTAGSRTSTSSFTRARAGR
jgi:exodeoxyribonuclease VII large subunit